MRPEYNQSPQQVFRSGNVEISSFINPDEKNIDKETVTAFGDEWKKFKDFSAEDLSSAGSEYFDIVTDHMLNRNSVVLDLGCGSGRWSLFVADKVNCVESIDPSDSIFSAAALLGTKKNVRVSQASADNIPFPDETFDILICLGVLHHLPETQTALEAAVKKIREGGHALLYFYYNLENRGMSYKFLFGIVNVLRKIISSMPKALRHFFCDVIAILVYAPVVGLARFIRLLFPRSQAYRSIPLSYYINKSFHIMRNDALDRFGTPLEKRFSRKEIEEMMRNAGLSEIVFSNQQPYWHCTGKKN